MGLMDRMETRPPPALALRAVLRARSALRRSRESMLPEHVAMLERTFAVIEVRALGIAAELDLAELVEARPRTSAELAAELDADADAVERLLCLLGATGCFRADAEGRWSNTKLSSVLRDAHPSSMRGWARFFAGADHFRIWADADRSIATGESATRAVTGHNFFEWAHETGIDAGERFDDAMRDGSRLVARSFVEVVDLDGATTICDVGGGTGALLGAVLEQNPAMRGVLFDLPAVVARGDALDQPGIVDRIEIVGGSFFEAVPRADRIVLVSIVHDWDDERAVEILRTCRESLPEDGRLLVVEPTLDPTRPPLIERHTDLLMLVLTGAGRERTRADFDRLFSASELRVTRTWLLATMQTVYELEALSPLDS